MTWASCCWATVHWIKFPSQMRAESLDRSLQRERQAGKLARKAHSGKISYACQKATYGEESPYIPIAAQQTRHWRHLAPTCRSWHIHLRRGMPYYCHSLIAASVTI